MAILEGGGRLVVEYMEEQLQGEGARGETARVQQWDLQFNIGQSSTDCG